MRIFVMFADEIQKVVHIEWRDKVPSRRLR
jgi:hypothetical protein